MLNLNNNDVSLRAMTLDLIDSKFLFQATRGSIIIRIQLSNLFLVFLVRFRVAIAENPPELLSAMVDYFFYDPLSAAPSIEWIRQSRGRM